MLYHQVKYAIIVAFWVMSVVRVEQINIGSRQLHFWVVKTHTHMFVMSVIYRI